MLCLHLTAVIEKTNKQYQIMRTKKQNDWRILKFYTKVLPFGFILKNIPR